MSPEIMGQQQFVDAYAKALKVIVTCKDADHFKGAKRYLENLERIRPGHTDHLMERLWKYLINQLTRIMPPQPQEI